MTHLRKDKREVAFFIISTLFHIYPALLIIFLYTQVFIHYLGLNNLKRTLFSLDFLFSRLSSSHSPQSRKQVDKASPAQLAPFFSFSVFTVLEFFVPLELTRQAHTCKFACSKRIVTKNSQQSTVIQ